MADISKIQINSETYSVKDAKARTDFRDLVSNQEDEDIEYAEYIIDCGDARSSVSSGYIEH